jgi:hypothetical protein
LNRISPLVDWSKWDPQDYFNYRMPCWIEDPPTKFDEEDFLKIKEILEKGKKA